MKLFAFVDLHGSLQALKHVLLMADKADIVVCAGDLSNFEHNLELIVQRLGTISKPVLIIHGNHETPERLKAMCSGFKNLIFLHRGLFQLGSFSFVGYGGGGFSSVDRGFERFGKRVSRHLNGKLVLITHAPPYYTLVDNIYGEHRGNRSIRNFILKEKPVLAVCGHLHETVGVEDYIGDTRVINPGPKGMMLII